MAATAQSATAADAARGKRSQLLAEGSRRARRGQRDRVDLSSGEHVRDRARQGHPAQPNLNFPADDGRLRRRFGGVRQQTERGKGRGAAASRIPLSERASRPASRRPWASASPASASGTPSQPEAGSSAASTAGASTRTSSTSAPAVRSSPASADGPERLRGSSTRTAASRPRSSLAGAAKFAPRASTRPVPDRRPRRSRSPPGSAGPFAGWQPRPRPASNARLAELLWYLARSR